MKLLSNSRCQAVSAGKACPACDERAAWMRKHFRGDVAHGASACALVLAQRVPPSVLQRRTRLARADVFADQMRLAHRHVKFWRGVLGGSDGAYSMTRHSWPGATAAGRSSESWRPGMAGMTPKPR